MDEQVSTILRLAVHWPQALIDAMTHVHKTRANNYRWHKCLSVRVKRAVQKTTLEPSQAAQIVADSKANLQDFTRLCY